MDRSEEVVLNEFFGKQYSVFVVITFPRHKADENVPAERKFAVAGRGSVGEDVAFFDSVARVDDRVLVKARSLIGTREFFKGVNSVAAARGAVVFGNDYLAARNVFDDARLFGDYEYARIVSDFCLDTRTYDRSFGFEKGNSLTLHVGAHQRTVRIAVFKERYKRGSNRNELLGRNVDVIDFFFRKFGYLVPSSARDTGVYESALFVERFVCLSDDESVFLVGGKVIDYIGYFAGILIDSSVSGFDETVLVDFRVSRKRSDKTDVLTFGGLYRAHTTVMGIVNVSDFKRRAFSVKTAGTERGKFTLMRKFGYRVRLIHELRQLRRTEEFLNRAGNGTNVDETRRRYVFGILRRHSLLDDSFESGDTYSELIL